MSKKRYSMLDRAVQSNQGAFAGQTANFPINMTSSTEDTLDVPKIDFGASEGIVGDLFSQEEKQEFEQNFTQEKPKKKKGMFEDYQRNFIQEQFDKQKQEADFKAETQRILMEPVNVVEQELLNNLSNEEYLSYKNDKNTLAELDKKTLQGSLREEYKEDNYEFQEFLKLTGLQNAPDLVKEAFAAAGNLVHLPKNIWTPLMDQLSSEKSFTKEEKKKYDELKEKIELYEKPVLDKQRKIVETEYQKAISAVADVASQYSNLENQSITEAIKYSNANPEEANRIVADKEKLDFIHKNYQKALRSYDDAINKTGYWNRFFQDPEELASLGLSEFRESKVNKELKEKIDKQGYESLSPVEKEMAKASQIVSEINNQQLNPNVWDNIGASVRESALFMGEMYVTDRLTGGLGRGMKLATVNTLKGAGLAGIGLRTALSEAKVLGNVLGTVGKSALTPDSYNKYVDASLSSGQIINRGEENEELVFSDARKKAIIKDTKAGIEQFENELLHIKSKAKTTDLTQEEENRILQLHKLINNSRGTINELADEEGNLRKEELSDLESYAKTVQGKMYERFAETHVGALGDEIFSGIGSKLAKSSLNKTWAGRQLSNINTEYSNLLNSANRALVGTGNKGKLTKAFAGHIGGAKILNSIPSEVLEEVFSQMMPVIGEDYVDQVTELVDPNFYGMVLASTLILGGKGALLGAGSNAFNYASNAEYRDQVDRYNQIKSNQKKLYHDLDKKGITDEGLASRIAMNTLGSIYQYNDYISEISKLKKESLVGTPEEKADKIQQAKNLENTSFYNMALQAVNTGTTEELRNTLKRLANKTRSKNTLGATSVEAIERGIETLNRLEDITNSYSNRINYEEIANLNIQKDMVNTAITQLEERKESIRSQAEKEMQSYNKKNKVDGYSLGDFTSENMSDLEQDESALRNNYVAEVIGSNPNSVFKQFVELQLQQEALSSSIDKIDQDLNYELDDNNAAAIKARQYIRGKQNYLDKIVDEETFNAVIKDTENLKNESYYNTFLDEAKEKLRKSKVQEAVRNTLGKVYGLNESSLSSPGISNPNNVSEDVLPDSAEVGIVVEPENIPSDDVVEPFTEWFDDDSMFAREAPKPFSGGETFSLEGLDGEAVELSPEESALLNQTKNMFEPIIIEDGNREHLNKVEGFEKVIGSMIAKQPTVTFEGLVSALFNNPNIGSVRVNKMYNFLAEAWNNTSPNKLNKQETQTIFETLYPSADVVAALSEVFNNANTIASSPIKQDTASLSPAPVNAVQEYNIEKNSLENVQFAPHTERLWADVGLKLGGVLGINYRETDLGREDITDAVNTEALPFMDWRNFREGSKIELTFNIDYLLDPESVISVWENLEGLNIDNQDKPVSKKIKIRERLLDIFKNDESLNTWEKIQNQIEEYAVNKNPNNPLFKNEEFLKSIPVGTVNKGYVSDFDTTGTEAPSILPGGLNDYYWINNRNVALKVAKNTGEPLLAEREKRIRANREINLNARKAILENGSLSVTINEKRDAKNNTRELITEEDKERGYTEDFHDLLLQVGNTLEAFNKQSAVGHMDANNFVAFEDNAGRKVPIKINGKEVKKESILNYESFYNKALQSGFTSGRTVFITQDGLDSKGEPVYLVHNIVNNHFSKQEEFRKESDIINKIYFKIISPTSNDYTNDKKEQFKRNFKSQFGYDFNQSFKDKLQLISPSKLLDNTFRQDYNSKALTPSSNPKLDLIPDLSSYNNVTEFIDAVLNNQPIPKINKLEKVIRNLHTNLVFTPIEKNGETIYVNHSQPIISFNFNAVDSVSKLQQEEEKNSDYKKLLQLRKAALEKDNTEESQEELKEINRELQQIAEKEREIKQIKKVVDPVPSVENNLIQEIGELLNTDINESNSFAVTDYAKNFVDLNIIDILNELESMGIIQKDC